MNDYKLSDLQKECKQHDSCSGCRFADLICRKYPYEWNIHELHEPITEIHFTQRYPMGLAVVKCAVCNVILETCPFTKERITLRYSNYCPGCGARLKEVK